MNALRATLRSARYAVPKAVANHTTGPSPAAAAQLIARLSHRGFAATAGYFQADSASDEEIVQANVAMARMIAGTPGAYLSVKAPPLRFEPDPLARIEEAASAAGLPILFDSHASKDADATLALAERTGGIVGGVVLPARWRRSMADADRFRSKGNRIRIVKGEWPDLEADEDGASNYLALAERLAGRAAPVAVATHDPELAERALTILREAGTPCELEQLRGLPSRRTRAVAKRVGVAVRIYIPFGPGWWPYAVNKALERPYLPLWMMKDLLGR